MATTVLAGFIPVGAHTSTALTGAVTTLSVDSRATGVLIQAETQNVRYTLDGTNPTSSLGFVLTADADPVIIPKNSDITIKVLRSASGAVIQYQGVLDG